MLLILLIIVFKYFRVIFCRMINFDHLILLINPRRMREGYGSRSVCVSVCVSVTAPAATYLFYTSKTRCH